MGGSWQGMGRYSSALRSLLTAAKNTLSVWCLKVLANTQRQANESLELQPALCYMLATAMCSHRPLETRIVELKHGTGDTAQCP